MALLPRPHYGSVLTTLPVYVTEILIYSWIEAFPAFLCKINMYPAFA